MYHVCLERPGCAWDRVQAGESLADVARRCGTAPMRLLELNPYIDPAELVEGQPVFVPLRPRALHARFGESWAELAARARVDMDALRAGNPRLTGPLPPPGARIVIQ